MMSNDGLIIEYMDLSHIHLAVRKCQKGNREEDRSQVTQVVCCMA